MVRAWPLGRAAVLVLLVAAVVPGTAACPFCGPEGATLVGDFTQASMVVFGSFTNARLGANGLDGTTDFIIEKVLKPHEYLKSVKGNTITIPKHLPFAKNKFLLFIDVYKGNLDAYRGVETTADSDLIKYLEGAIKIHNRPMPERLRYCFDFLNNPDFEVAMDAYREFAKADYKDYKDMAAKLPADVIAGWLKDPKTPSYRYGLYASLLGHCGNAEHAKLLRSMIEDPEVRKGSGVDGMLFANILIEPKSGWQYLLDHLKNGKHDFTFRYTCLRTIRVLWEHRQDVVSPAQLVQGIDLILDQPDIADFGIADLRRWRRWEMTDRVLSLFDRKEYAIPVVKREILRFALCSPEPKAKHFVAAQRARDAEWVRDVEELLQLEIDTQPPPAKK
ncbi:MAG: hypothetical protein NZO58_02705 [Gemmataceae bacterium]|nr:hypothetical protein [Gemmataceae bacterium]